MRVKIVWSLLVSAVLLCCATNLAAKSEVADSGNYTTKDKEFYLTPEMLIFIRPGLDIEIVSVVIPADMRLEVTYTIKDPAGLPLDHDGIYTPGPVDMRFTLANIPMGEEQKVRLASERIDRGNGELTQLAPGEYKYKFETVLDSDQDTTHTLVLGGRRDLREFELDRYADNAMQNWVPSGLFDAVPRDIVTTDTCNRCHDPLQLHGRWQQPQTCTNCHNPTGNTRWDELIHAVHAAGEAGGHDFSTVTYPAPLNACETCHTGGTPTEAFPLVATPNPVPVCDMTGSGVTQLQWGDLAAFEIHMGTANGQLFAATKGAGSAMTGKWVRDGTTFVLVDKASGDTLQTLHVNTTALGCVSNAPGTFRGEAGAQHTNWLDHPSRVVCGACHSNVNFETGEGHSDGNIPVDNDSICGNCHRPDTGNEFDRSVKGAHTELYKSSQLPGVIVEFAEVTNTGPGEHPTVTFSVGSKNGPINPASMNRLRFKLSGPNDDFSFYASEDVTNYVQSGEYWAYTFNTAIPADAEGSFTISVEARNNIDVDLGDEISSERDTAENTQIAFAVTDSAAMWRRTVVDDYNCENCHSNLSFHGGNRHDPNYCAVCHMPEATGEGQTIHLKYMVHSIHSGEELANGFAIGSHDYSEVVYPGDLRNCDSCHTGNSQQIPLAAGVLPTMTPQAWWSPMQPQAAACLSCHDGDDAAVHAYTNTAFFGESCSTCHGEGKEVAVDKVHAR